MSKDSAPRDGDEMKRRYIVRSYFAPRRRGEKDCICCPEEGWHRSYHRLHSEIDERLTGDEAYVELPREIMYQLPDGHLIEVTVRDLGMSDLGKARRWELSEPHTYVPRPRKP